MIDRLGHPALDDLGQRLAAERAVALAPLQAVRLHLLHDGKGGRLSIVAARCGIGVLLSVVVG